jgi:membrane-bound lytic murein transglycosylase A
MRNKAMRLQPLGRFVLSVLVLFSLIACAKRLPVTSPEDALERISWRRAAAPLDDLAFRDLGNAVRGSLDYYRKVPPNTVFIFGSDRVTALDMILTLQNFLLIVENGSLNDQEKAERIRNGFDLYQSVGSNSNGKVLFTGYYEPTLSCRMAPQAGFSYPLYRKPDDIIEVDLTLFGSGFPKNKLLGRLDGKKIVPYYSREEIDQKNALARKDLEILWCNDPIDIYFLQVQGSGKVDLGNGTILSVLYDGANGRPYKGAGSYLINAGIIPKEEMSMQMIRQYLRDNPDQVASVLNQNPSYVFFRLESGPSVGNISVPLTPGRSIATDSRLFPKGALALIVTEKPVIENGVIKEWTRFTRFVVNQDTGGAIKGPGRVDLFWGQGPEAEISAGYMQQEGNLYFLVRKKQ